MKKNNEGTDAAGRLERRRRAFEGTATFGLLLLAIGLVAPFTDLTNGVMLSVFKWIFSAGALVFTVSRIAGGADPGASVRVRRLHRLEIWAGVAFCVAAFFWFYNTSRYPYMSLRVMQDTVVFTLVGALIQIIASWMMAARVKKERSDDNKAK